MMLKATWLAQNGQMMYICLKNRHCIVICLFFCNLLFVKIKINKININNKNEKQKGGGSYEDIKEN